jgi:hypothetical protein
MLLIPALGVGLVATALLTKMPHPKSTGSLLDFWGSFSNVSTPQMRTRAVKILTTLLCGTAAYGVMWFLHKAAKPFPPSLLDIHYERQCLLAALHPKEQAQELERLRLKAEELKRLELAAELRLKSQLDKPDLLLTLGRIAQQEALHQERLRATQDKADKQEQVKADQKLAEEIQAAENHDVWLEAQKKELEKLNAAHKKQKAEEARQKKAEEHAEWAKKQVAELEYYEKQQAGKKADSTAAEETIECPICLAKITSGLKVTPCGHKFHECCIGDWAKRDSTCPICRRKI